jgi:hypothetical protein
MPDQFRIVQHDRTLYFLYSEEGSPEAKVFATYPLERAVTAPVLNLWTIASGGKREAITCWKRIEIHSSQP